MAKYIFIGGDRKQYGPVTDEQLCQWIREGRVRPQSQLKVEGDEEWRPASSFPDFAEMFGSRKAGSTSTMRATAYIALISSCIISLPWPLFAFGSLFAFDAPSKGVMDTSVRMIQVTLMLTYPWGLLAGFINFLSRKKGEDWCTNLTVAFLTAPIVQFVFWLLFCLITNQPANESNLTR